MALPMALCHAMALPTTHLPFDLLRVAPGVAIDTSLSYCHFALNDTSLVSSGFVDFCTARNIARHTGLQPQTSRPKTGPGPLLTP